MKMYTMAIAYKDKFHKYRVSAVTEAAAITKIEELIAIDYVYYIALLDKGVLVHKVYKDVLE